MSLQFDYIKNPPKLYIKNGISEIVLAQVGSKVIDEKNKEWTGLFIIQDCIIDDEENYVYKFKNADGGTTSKQNGFMLKIEFILYCENTGFSYLDVMKKLQSNGEQVVFKQNVFPQGDIRNSYVNPIEVEIKVSKRKKITNRLDGHTPVFDGEEVSLMIKSKELVYETPYKDLTGVYGSGKYGEGIYGN